MSREDRCSSNNEEDSRCLWWPVLFRLGRAVLVAQSADAGGRFVGTRRFLLPWDVAGYFGGPAGRLMGEQRRPDTSKPKNP